MFEVAWDESARDLDQAIFTLAVRDTNCSNRWFSDFSETVHAPKVRYLVQRTERGHYGAPLWTRIWPTLSNLGSATADSCVVFLKNPSPGIYLPYDSITVVGSISPGDTATAQDFLEIRFFAQTHDVLRYDIEIRTYHTNEDSTVWEREDLDTNAPSAPHSDSLVTDEAGGSVILRWTKSDSSDVEGYHVFKYMPGDTVRVTREPIVGTTRYEITGLEALDDTLDYIDYRYAVTAVDFSGNESAKVVSDTARVWLPEVLDWPKRVRGGSDCAPKVFDIDGDGDLEIFAAGQEIYAWHHDGQPVDSSNADGLFYDPPNAPSDARFIEALAIADIDNDGKYEVVGNFQPGDPGKVYVVEYDPSNGGSVNAEWYRNINSWKAAPILEDLDEDGNLEVLLPGNNYWIYVWTHDGKTFRKTLKTHGRFARTVDSTRWCYRSLAVGDVYDDSSGVEIIQALKHGKVAAYPTTVHDPQQRIWIQDLPGTSELSTPLIGDVDGDSHLEVVTTRRKSEGGDGMPSGGVDTRGGVWVLDASSGNIESSVTADSLGFRFTGKPPAAGALAKLDDDGDLDVVVGGGRFGTSGSWTKILRMHALFDDPPGGLDALTVDDEIMIPGRKFYSTATWNEPVVGDLDGDGRLEILAPTDAGYLACFEWDPAVGDHGEGRPERGWPQLFADVPLTPTIANVDNTSPKLEMVVQDRAGWVHLFRLPADTTNADLPWPEYGHDPRNTFNAQTGRGLGDGGRQSPGSDICTKLPAGLRVGPSPLIEPVAWMSFEVKRPEPVELQVFDVQGRCLRVLVDGVLPSGKYRIPWHGNTDRGRRVGSGIYFARLVRPDGVEVRKISVVR